MIDPIAVALCGIGTSPMLMATDGFIGAELPPVHHSGGYVHLGRYQGASKTYTRIAKRKADNEILLIVKAFIDNVLTTSR